MLGPSFCVLIVYSPAPCPLCHDSRHASCFPPSSLTVLLPCFKQTLSASTETHPCHPTAVFSAALSTLYQTFLPLLSDFPTPGKAPWDGVGDEGWGMEGRGCGVCGGVFPLLTDVQALERHTHRCSVNTEMNVLQPAGAFGPPSTPLRG